MRIACLLAEGFEDAELREPYDRYRAAGHSVELIGLRRGESLVGKHGRERVVTTAEIGEVRPDAFDALFIPGGSSPARLAKDARVVAFVRGFRERPIFAICHGPQLLISADLVRDRSVTAWKSVQPELARAGAEVHDRAVVVDRGLVTSRRPDDLEDFIRESLAVLQASAPAAA